MLRKTPENHTLIVSINTAIRLEFQTYLHSILGKYITFDTIDLYQAYTPSQIGDYQCILFSSEEVQKKFPLTIPNHVAQLVCTRTFNHAFLDQIIRIPPNEHVYLVNDSYDSILSILEQFQAAGITQYHFTPYYPGCDKVDESIQYAITVGEPQLVPKHIRNVINIGNRIIDISTINELCSLFHLPPNLSNQITQSYINRILQITKLTGTYYSNYIYSRQLLQAVIQNMPAGMCLMTAKGEISMINGAFSADLEISGSSACNKPLTAFLPPPFSTLDFCRSADYQLESRSGKQVDLSVLELSLPNHAPAYLITSKQQPLSSERGTEPFKKQHSSSEISRSANDFPSILTASVQVKRMLEYTRRLALYDFPVLIQGEVGTQKKLIATSIHKNSNRRQHPLTLLHSFCEIPEKGSPAHQLTNFLNTIGKGTLLIDRAEHLSLEMQDLLIDVLQTGSQENYHFHHSQSTNVRIIATAGQDLYEGVLNGTFREELFFLLNTASIDTIPLRERKDDIPLLLEYFFQNLFHDPGLHLKDVISSSLMDFLLNYEYPGNVQELRNLTRFFFTQYAAHPLILSQLPSYIRRRLGKPLTEQSAIKNSILSLIATSPRIGRSNIKEILAKKGMDISEGKLRSLLKELSDAELIQINRTRGGCEITELGMTTLQ